MPRRSGSPWRVVAGATAALAVGNGPIMQFTFGLFLKPIGDDLALSRGAVSAALSFGLLGTALVAPWAGRAMDRVGAVRVILCSIVAFAAMLALQGLLARGAASLTALSILMGVAAAGQTPIGYARAIVTWFDRRRGLALGIAMTGIGIGTIVVPIVTQRLIDRFGWRSAYCGLSVLLLAIALPAVAACIRERRHPAAASAPVAHAAAKAARKTRPFLILAAAFTLVTFAANGTIAHVVPLLTDRGLSAAVASSSLASIGIALICGRLAAGALLDRVDPILVTACFFAAVLLGVVLLIADALGLTRLALFAIGLGLGAEIDLLAFLVGRYFAIVAFGELYGALFGLFMVGSSLGPLVVGLSYDWTGSYRIGLVGTALCLAAAIGSILLLRETRFSSNERHA